MKKRLLLFVTAAVGSLCFAIISPAATVTTQTPDPSLYDANLIASTTPGPAGTTVWFEWGIDTSYGQLTPATNLQGTNALSVSNLITGLTPYTTYHCQAVASNVLGTVYGGDVSFITVPKFVQVGTNTDWSALRLSGDGRELVAARGGIVYVSTNLGAQFTVTTGTGSVFALSSDGSVILTVSGTNVCVSIDRGSTWTTNNTPTAFSYFAASSDARKLVATDGSFGYTSTNFGATWKQHIVPYGSDYALASSADGSRLYGAAFPARETGAAYGSTDSGNTWASLGLFSAITGLNSIACSADGSILAAAGEVFVISTNGGASWSGYGGAFGTTGYTGIATSADGRTFVISTSFGRIAVSPDTGMTWYGVNPMYGLSGGSVMSSADGNTLAAFNGSIYISQPSLTGALQVNLGPAGAVTAGAQWQLDNAAWETNGTVINGLAVGNHTISFISIAGWTSPSNLTVSVSDNQTTVITGTYVQQTGSLEMNLTPAGAVVAGAQWQVDGGVFQATGATVGGLAVGNHLVNFAPVNGWTTPSNRLVSIGDNVTNVLTAAYLAADSLQVYLTPPGAVSAGAAWQLDAGASQTNGAIVTGLTPGSHAVSFTSVSGWTTPGNQTFNITNNQTNVLTGAYLQQFGSLQVNIVPTGAVTAGAHWQADGGALQNSGAILSGLAVGNHTVHFTTVNGWAKPGDLTASIGNNQTSVISGTYAQVGSLQVNLAPPGAVSAGAQWQVDGGTPQTNAAVVNGLIAGSHTVSFTTVSGWSAPKNQTVAVTVGGTNVTLGSYTLPTVVTNADQATLQRALAGGGTVTFSIDGTFVLTNAIIISNNTVLDATGHNITLSGGSNAQIFVVNSGASLFLNALTLANGLAPGTAVSGSSGPGLGGAISNGGILQVVGCVFTNNGVTGPPGYLNGPPGQGGAIFNAGALFVSNSAFLGNQAVGLAGYLDWLPFTGGEGDGGAIYNASNAVIANCTFSSNTALGGTGANGGSFDGGQGGHASGGAIANAGNLLLVNSTFFENTVTGGFGGTGGQGGNSSGTGGTGDIGGTASDGNGGALCCFSGNTVVVNSTFVSNSAFGGQGGTGGIGGYATPFGGAPGRGGNGANGGNGFGGGINLLAGAVCLTNVTCANNLSAGGVAGSGGAGANEGYEGPSGPPGANGMPGTAMGDTVANVGGSFLVQNSILDCTAGGTNSFGPLIDAGYNLNSDSTGFLTNSTSLNNTNPLLGTLGNYGGATQTIPLLEGSPAINAADPLAFPPTDQRGNPRPSGPAPDIGAFEYNNAPQWSGMTVSRGVAQFVLNGQAGSVWAIQVSSNLVNWSAMSTNTIPVTGSMVITDPGAAGLNQRFYRAASQ